MPNASSTSIRTPNVGGRLKSPQFVVVHYTVSGDLRGTVRWLCNPKARASAHVVVGRDGELDAVVPFDRVAWHAGASSYKGVTGLNSHSIGIELVNWGPLKQNDTTRSFSPVTGQQLISPDDVFTGKHKNGSVQNSFWQKYPGEQIAALDQLLGELFSDFPSLREIVGHDDICVPAGRKTDPGPALGDVMQNLRAKFNRY